MRAGDQLMELCERVSEGFPPVVAREFLSYTYKFKGAAPYPFLQVGDKKIFAERYRWLLAAMEENYISGLMMKKKYGKRIGKCLSNTKALPLSIVEDLRRKGERKEA
eukprot:CAMPEP_0196821364 /NCGR_PEP_ID=MMETSP1362-20130617/78951_1 /TAXON_ID=163516 /ORGANISM="Leptocylindrus danicus, Strain CCMP1856" /LENGTH=106 /DNA_ID=CAMNT_0042200527 /DNA_START=86 /DNA_END=407 /DNA_ORIENTATION=+